MKKNLFMLIFMLAILSQISANGVCIVNAQNGSCLYLIESNVDVAIENQVSIVTTTQSFINDSGENWNMQYAFPLSDNQSATGLRWMLDETWYEAVISPTEPDTIPGGSSMHPDLFEYLGETPMFFSSEDVTIAHGEVITVELTYVQLLPYSMGTVSFSYPNDYTLIQPYQELQRQGLHIELNSMRTIEEVELLSHTPTQLINNGYQAIIDYAGIGLLAYTDYIMEYSLSLDELGLFSMSTYLDSEDVPDEYGNGFFTFIAEPDPNDSTSVIQKVFTLIIDKSGSMTGNKIQQARNAALYVVNNFNDGDMFNLVAFSGGVTAFENQHVLYSQEVLDEAEIFINSIYANGTTNISGAFDVAVPQFNAASDNTANIIIFFTDGLPTTGITNSELLLEHINDLIVTTETDIDLHTFGIGNDADPQFLAQLAYQNDGVNAMLEDEELETAITDFFNIIGNPVLLNPQLTFTPANIVSEIYPDPLTNLYQGSQMIVSGRYTEPVDMTIEMEGTAFGQPVSYEYEFSLCDSADAQFQFLTKLWAKTKIEHLIIEYYLLDPESPEAQEIYDLVVQISIDYGVLSEFTSFVGPGTAEDENTIPQDDNGEVCLPYKLLGNYPNPFNPETTIRFLVENNHSDIVILRIYNSKGQLVKLLAVQTRGAGNYEIIWDGTNQDNKKVTSGVYFYTLDFGDAVLASKMIMIK